MELAAGPRPKPSGHRLYIYQAAFEKTTDYIHRWSVVENTGHNLKPYITAPKAAGTSLCSRRGSVACSSFLLPELRCIDKAHSCYTTPTTKKFINFKFITNQLNIPYNTIYLTISHYISSDRFLLRSKYNIK